MDTTPGMNFEIYRFLASAPRRCALTTAISLTGCSEDSLRNGGGPKSEPPVAALVAALVGVVPLDVTLDASASLTT